MKIRNALFVVVVSALIASCISPYDRLVWLAEVMPVVILLPVLMITARRFPMTTLTYGLLALLSLIIILGGTYTFSRVPLGLQVQDVLALSRNPYDRIAHFFQGVTPAILGRELLLRTSPLRPGKWLFLILALGCLGISAAYELVEWAAAMFWGEGSVEFLGTQGDPWDAQWDMLTALSGAITAQILLSRWHDRQLNGIEKMMAGRKGAPVG